MSIVTTDQIKGVAQIPLSVTEHDTTIDMIRDAVNASLLKQLQISDVSPTQYVTTVDLQDDMVNRVRTIRIGPAPLISVDEVQLDGAVVTETTRYTAKGQLVKFAFGRARSDYTEVLTGRLPVLRTYQLTVTAGWAGGVVPGDVVLGAATWGAQLFKGDGGGMNDGLKSERWGSYARTKMTAEERGALHHGPQHWPPMLASALAPYISVTSSLPTATVEL